jgi:hypothetical protein
LDELVDELVRLNKKGEIFIVGSFAIMLNNPDYYRVTTDIDVKSDL